jgi:hypothetical protein
MTITITISGNMEYCDENCPEKVIPADLECQCVIGTDTPDPDCHCCAGTGIDPIMTNAPGDYPHEMNVSNANFKLIWNCLGFEANGDSQNALNAMVLDANSSTGEMYGHELFKAIEAVNPDLFVRSARYGPDFNSFEFGIDAERVSWYLTRLKEIASEAMRREEKVVWH